MDQADLFWQKQSQEQAATKYSKMVCLTAVWLKCRRSSLAWISNYIPHKLMRVITYPCHMQTVYIILGK